MEFHCISLLPRVVGCALLLISHHPLLAADPSMAELDEKVEEAIDRCNYKGLAKAIDEWQGDGTGALPICRDGQSRLSVMHFALKHYPARTPRAYQQFQTLLDAWQKAEPESGQWRIYQAFHLCDHIMNAKADPNTLANWATVTRLLDEAEIKMGRKADWYCSYLRLVTTANWLVKHGQLHAVPPKLMDWLPMADEGIRRFPDHLQIPAKASAVVEYLNCPGGIDGFARHICVLIPARGLEPYARLWWSWEYNYNTTLFQRSHADWPTFREGFYGLLKRHPDSKWLVAKFLEFSRKADDKDTAKALLARLGDHPDGETFMVEARFLEIRQWAMGQPLVRTPVWAKRGKKACSVEWSKEGKVVYSGHASSTVHVYNALTGDLVTQLRLDDNKVARIINDIAVSPDGRLVAAVNGGETDPKPGICRVWRTDNYQLEDQFTSKAGPLRSIAWAPDSAQLIAAGGLFEGPGEVWLWAKGGRGAESLPWAMAELHSIEAAAWSQNNSKVLFNSIAGKITVSEPSQQLHRVEQIVVPRLTWVTGIRFSPDSQWVAASCAYSFLDQAKPNGAVALFRASDMAPRNDVLPPLTEGLLTVDWSPDGKWIASGGYDGYVYLLDAATLEMKQWWNPQEGVIRKLRWSPDGSRLAIATYSGWISIWKAP